MSDYEDRLRGGKKIELSNRVTSTVAEDIWCMSYMAKGPEEFVDYLMTITDQEAIEEFFNKCHDEGGRFCGGGSGSGSKGPVSGRSRLLDFFKPTKFVPGRDDDLQKEYHETILFDNPMGNKKTRTIEQEVLRRDREVVSGKAQTPATPSARKTKHGQALNVPASDKLYQDISDRRAASPNFKNVTRPAGSLKLRKLAKTDLSKMDINDVKLLHTAAGAMQQANKTWSRISLVFAAGLVGITGNPIAAPISTSLFIAESIQSKRYKTQRARLGKELTRRKEKPEYFSLDADFYDSQEELAVKDLKLSPEDKELIPKFIVFLTELIEDNDGDFSEEEIVGLKNLRTAAGKV